jgi:hypothetical protein
MSDLEVLARSRSGFASEKAGARGVRRLPDLRAPTMDALTAFGLLSVSVMVLCYALEDRSHWLILAFAASCALASICGFLQGAWPSGLVEGIWMFIALRRWRAKPNS